jgi:hypothetical protein
MEQRGIVSSLFDLSFTHLITPRIQKFLYALLLIGAVIAGFSAFIAVFGMGSGFFGRLGGLIGGLIAGPLVFLVLAMQARVMMEILIVIFKAVEYLAEISASVKR